jgi:hypothetical protein
MGELVGPHFTILLTIYNNTHIMKVVIYNNNHNDIYISEGEQCKWYIETRHIHTVTIRDRTHTETERQTNRQTDRQTEREIVVTI